VGSGGAGRVEPGSAAADRPFATLRVVVEPEEQPLDSPPVLAVVVTHGRHADRFEDLLGSLAEQDYPRLSVLVVDASGGDDPTDRVRAVVATSRVLRVPATEGFGRAANHVLDRDRPRARRSEFFVFCHDDVLPDPGAVAALVEAASEWGADVVGPKFVARDDPRRLLQVGLGVDRVGTTMPLVEHRELDQGQHDGVREVFAFPAGFTLVRAARFAALGGFDEAIDSPDDDLSLCWRARAAGSPVLLATDAKVRRDERSSAGPRDQARWRVRALLSCSSRLDLLRIVPQAFALSLVQAIGGLVTGRPGQSRAAVGAWVWNLLHPLSLWRARRRVNSVRQASSRDVHRLQVRGLIRPRLWLRRMGRNGASPDAAIDAPAGRDPSPADEPTPPGDADAPWTPATALITVLLAGVVLFGSRHLVTRLVPAVGEFVAFPGSSGDLVREWVGGYRSVGLGADASAPTLVGVAGGLGAVLAGHLALARTLLIVGLVPVGVVGAYRLLRPTGSKAAQVAAAVAYAAVPLPYDGLATGRWSVTAAYAAAPWLLGRLARSSLVAPFSPDGPVPVAPRPLWQHVVATGAVTGLAGLLVPQAAALLLLVGLGLMLGTLFALQGRGIGRLAAVSVGAALVAALLHLPALVDVLRSRTAADAWMGLERPAGALTALDLLRFDTGPLAIAPLGFCLAGAAALPLLVARDWRLGWAVRAWVVALACWGLLWAQEQGHVDVRLPDPGVVMAPAAAALAFAAALGVAAMEMDVRRRPRPEQPWERVPRRVGFGRILSALGILALAAATAPVVVAAMDGWWNMPRGQFGSVMRSVDAAVTAEPSRVLWVGDPAVLPGGQAWELDDGLSYTALGAAMPGVADLWPATGLGSSDRLGEALRLASAGQTSKLGRMLAPMGVQYVAVPHGLAPASAVERSDGSSRGSGSATLASAGAVDRWVQVLDGQLDLEQIAVDDALALYRNVAFAPMRATGIDPAALDETSVAAMQHVDLSAASAVLVESDGDGRASRGALAAGDTVVQASSSSDRWVLEIGGHRAERTDAYGWADAFAVPVRAGGEAVLGYRTPPVRYVLVALQGALWLLALLVAVRMRFRYEAPAPQSRVDGAAAADDDRSGGKPAQPEETPDAEPSREGEPVPAGAGAPA
jgi:GT2 family glycosyltransferase